MRLRDCPARSRGAWRCRRAALVAGPPARERGRPRAARTRYVALTRRCAARVGGRRGGPPTSWWWPRGARVRRPPAATRPTSSVAVSWALVWSQPGVPTSAKLMWVCASMNPGRTTLSERSTTVRIGWEGQTRTDRLDAAPLRSGRGHLGAPRTGAPPLAIDQDPRPAATGPTARRAARSRAGLSGKRMVHRRASSRGTSGTRDMGGPPGLMICRPWGVGLGEERKQRSGTGCLGRLPGRLALERVTGWTGLGLGGSAPTRIGASASCWTFPGAPRA